MDHIFAVELYSGVNENSRLDDLSVFDGSDVETKVEGVLGVGVDTKGKWAFESLDDGLRVTENLIDADGKDTRGVAEHDLKFFAREDVVVGSIPVLEEVERRLILEQHYIVIVHHVFSYFLYFYQQLLAHWISQIVFLVNWHRWMRVNVSLYCRRYLKSSDQAGKLINF